MAEHTTFPAHPGAYIKASVLPPGMSVKKAAELLGVGRPALSNLLNEHASLSPEMALRLEKAFGAKRVTLLRMQASYDEARTRSREKEVAVRAYAPSFMDITATQIAAWADQTSARPQLAAFLRRLVLTTGSNLTKVDFPAYDNAQRHGWDGRVETDTATPWIPSGVSGWEFGCNQDPRQKAEEDYSARVAGIPSTEQKITTFVFVTPRNWPGKDAWAQAKREDTKWKDVRALDASDLEQWLEQSVPAQSWMAERLGVASEDILSLDVCWDRWSKVTKPELSKELFRGAIEAHENTLVNWLKEPPERPLVITADSEEESLAFVACAFESLGAVKGEFYDRTVVLRSVAAFSKATKASSAFIPIIVSADVEFVSAGLHRAQRTIIIRRRNAVEGKPDIALDLIDDATFRKALTAMRIPDEEIPVYARASGQSATILRRRLSDVPAIKFPPWAEDNALTRKLIPIGFAGVWNSEMKADREILSFLTGDSYEDVEISVTELLNLDQPPVWWVGRMRGVVSKIDVLFGIHRLVTRKDLENLFFTARLVLSERDPSLDLPEDQRYAASLYGKTRDHSGPLREGICETLVLLAVHGKNLFRDRPGIDIEGQVNAIVRELLTPFNAETWASQRSDLPRYAEIAPDQFLDIVESDLRSNDPKILSLLKPASAGLFGGGCPRTGLLWALELLAWQPERLPHVARLLARLSEPEIDDNWQNKPENSLKSIFRAWMPQTAANVEQRKAVLEAITRQFPKVGWRLCVDQFDPHSTMGQYNERPRWRKDASGAGQPVSGNERYQFVRKALDIAIDWPAHNEQTLSDLIECLQSLPDEDKEKVWDRIREWISLGPSDDQKATLRERIRRYALTRRSRHRKLGSRTKDNAKEISELLLPSDPVVRHHWLFARQWVDESSEEIEDEKFDHDKREAKIAKLRADAVAEVWNASGYEGIVRLCESGEASHLIGGYLVALIGPGKGAVDFVSRLISEPQDRSPAHIESCASGFLSGMDDATRDDFLKILVQSFESEGSSGPDKIVRLMKCAPFGKVTWRRVDFLSPELQTRYWQECRPFWNRHEADELNEIIDRLLLVNRPRAALFAVHLDLKKIDSKRLMRLLREVATNGSEPPGHYRIDPYEIARAFKVFDGRPEVSGDEIAQLEFLYLSVLDHEERGIPNLERQIAQSPALFVQALGLSYKRNDGGEDPPEWRIENEEARKNAASQTYRLLRKAKRIPGTKDDGAIDVSALKAWIVEVQALGKKYAREEVADSVIGELLSKSRPGEDGVWPPEPVRQALEETGTEKMAVGMAIGRYNQRGAHFRGSGGDDERAFAATYRGWAQKVSLDSPFTSRLLEQIARNYEREAEREDTDANLRRRLVY